MGDSYMNNDDNLDLLDLDDNATMDALPDAAPFVSPRPRRPWLLLGLAALVIILATYIIIRAIGSDSSSTVDVDLDAPAVVTVDAPGDVINVPPMAGDMPAPAPANELPAPNPAVAPVPVAKPAPANENVGAPVRVVEDRKPVTFNPDAPVAAKPAPQPAPKTVKSAPAKKVAATKVESKKPAAKKKVAANNGTWYVQFGSYSTRALAQGAERKIRAAHPALFDGHQFVILAAVLKDGTTTYRLRVAFKTSADANGFCRNAKSDGLDCYVAK